MPVVDDSLLSIPGLPGRWQYWGEADEAGTCWVVPADELAQQAAAEASLLPLDFMKVAKSALASSAGRQPPQLF